MPGLTNIDLAIWIPTWHRPHRSKEVSDNIEATTKGPFKIYWGVEEGERADTMAAADTGHEVIVNHGKPGYSDTVQTIYEMTSEPLFFVANDDFEFRDGWDVNARSWFEEHPETMVLAVDDGIDPQRYTTIFFTRRKYIDEQSGVIDMPRRVFYPYHHNFQDTEFCQTAKKRGMFAHLEGPCIKHHRLPVDETYLKNDKTSALDMTEYYARLPLFS